MNYARIITDQKIDESLRKMIISLFKYNDCMLIADLIGFSDDSKKYISDWTNGKVIINDISPDSWYNKRMSCKIATLIKHNFNVNDKVFVLDTDLLFQANIFDALEKSDIFLTERHYKYWYVVNGGVWGFVYNNKTKEFLNFFDSQVYNPTWKPFVDFQKQWNRLGNIDWWCDQDMLCTIHDNKLPFECIVKSLPPQYNFCPSVEFNIPSSYDNSRKEILEKIGNDEYKILHFKGALKKVLCEEIKV